MKSIEKIIRPDLLDLKPYSSARDEFEGEASVFLDANENPFENGVNRYPDPLQKVLKEQIAKLKSTSTENIFLGNGSDECIDLMFRLFCVPFQDEVTTITPSYGMYGVSGKINRIALNEVSLNPDFSLDVNLILEQAKTSKLLFLCSPNNPSGNCFPSSDLVKIIERFEGIVVIDEAYIDFSEQESFIQLIGKYSNLVITQTFSKAYGMAGIRLGMLFSNPEIIGYLNKIKPPYNINILTQEFALKKLEDISSIETQIKTLVAERKKMEFALNKIKEVQEVFPSDANFILIRIENADEVYKRLISKGIVVRNRSSQKLCENCLRLTVGTTQENELLISELEKL